MLCWLGLATKTMWLTSGKEQLRLMFLSFFIKTSQLLGPQRCYTWRKTKPPRTRRNSWFSRHLLTKQTKLQTALVRKLPAASLEGAVPCRQSGDKLSHQATDQELMMEDVWWPSRTLLSGLFWETTTNEVTRKRWCHKEIKSHWIVSSWFNQGNLM